METYSPSPDTPKAVQPHSLFSEANNEVRRHKWIRSEQAGRDLGEEAVREWVHDHWWGYLRARWLEHIQGFKFWAELERCTFGILQEQFPNDQTLLNNILDRLKHGAENLDIILWACNADVSQEAVHRILLAIDVNRLRLLKFFGPN